MLSEEIRYKVDAPHIDNWQWVMWRDSVHTSQGRLGLVILAGAKIIFEPIKIENNFRCLITVGAGLPSISTDGLDVLVKFKENNAIDSSEVVLLRHHINGFNKLYPWVELNVPMELIVDKTGSLIIECDPGPENNPLADHLSIYEFVVSSNETFKLNRSRAFKSRRMENEKKYFSAVYEHSMYNEQKIEP
jgi:hypothetical protein